MWQFDETKTNFPNVQKKKPRCHVLARNKCGKMAEKLVFRLWGSKECDWSTKEAEGGSGGILTIWRNELLYPVFTFICKGLSRIKVTINLFGGRTYWKEESGS